MSKKNPQDSTIRNVKALNKKIEKMAYEFKAMKTQLLLQKKVLPRSKWEMPVWEKRVKKK